MNKLSYSELSLTTEVGAICRTCSDYKGMTDCPECETTFCIMCSGGCEGCGMEIDYSR